MLPQPQPSLVAERLQRRRDAADRYRALRPARAAATQRRAERRTALRQRVGFGLVEFGLRLVATPRRGSGALLSLRRGS